MNFKRHFVVRFLVFAFFGFTLINLMFLNYVVFQRRSNTGSMQIVGSMQENAAESDICDTKQCVPDIYNAIYQATASQQLRPTLNTAQSIPVSGSQVKEYYVQLGTGTNSTNAWADVGGASAYVDSSAYGSIQTVTFEASVSIPTGNQTVYVQLYNATAQHPVWNSQVSLSGGTPQLLISSPITLDPGTNLYQVQMMSQLAYPSNLLQARIHIISVK